MLCLILRLAVTIFYSADDDGTQCSMCGERSQLLYTCGWMCCHPTCDQFWKLGWNGTNPPAELTYDDGFCLSKQQSLRHIEPSVPLCPNLPPGVPINGTTLSAKFWRGWWCSRCGKVSCRSACPLLPFETKNLSFSYIEYIGSFGNARTAKYYSLSYLISTYSTVP
jgi:hypothetical protein